jgi:hypothetical protein
MYSARQLPPDEWPRLVGTEAERIRPHLPSGSRVLVVEDGPAIVGCWILMPVVHAECLWIAAAHRGKASVARRLWTVMQRTAQAMGVPIVATAALTDDVRHLLEHVGATKVPGDHYALRVSCPH